MAKRFASLVMTAAASCLTLTAVAQEGFMDAGQPDPSTIAKYAKKPGYSPYAGRNYPSHVYWGDQHVHTAWSADAGMSGATLSPRDALRFARGEEVLSNTGQPVKLSRPLDWVAVTDHSDGAGIITELKAGNPELMADPTLKKWHDMMEAGGDEAAKATMELINAQSNKALPAPVMDPRFAKSVWQENNKIMEEFNDPGTFTAFIAYEWTSNAGGGDNLHRNVIYRDGKEKADRVLPFTTFDSENPENLWKWMENWEQKTGGSILAVPHNGNLSNGRMFELKTFEGNQLTKAWAEARARWEPLFEAIQTKGQSESHPLLSPEDEFAVGYELWDRGNLNLVPKKPGMIEYEYAREAFKNGLALEQQLGANPFKYGLVSGSDAHTGLTAMEENNFFCKFVSCEPRPERWSEDALKFGDRSVKGWEVTAAGFTGVWASENTREAIWDALKRKEVYSSSGPRIIVRFFGGYDFAEHDAATRAPAEVGYQKGVPMGGDLQRAPDGKAPTFLVAALKDPLGGNLDRIQIVKGWVDAEDKTHEKIYNAVWGNADKRKPDADEKIPPVGSTVDLAHANWTNTIGDPELITVWKDPDFNPSLRSFYYARVLEIPTPRWPAYDAKRFNVKMGDEVPMTTQERVFTSPIWYTPKG
jgi:Protein of unknown function (DUF3604)